MCSADMMLPLSVSSNLALLHFWHGDALCETLGCAICAQSFAVAVLQAFLCGPDQSVPRDQVHQPHVQRVLPAGGCSTGTKERARWPSLVWLVTWGLFDMQRFDQVSLQLPVMLGIGTFNTSVCSICIACTMFITSMRRRSQPVCTLLSFIQLFFSLRLSQSR